MIINMILITNIIILIINIIINISDEVTKNMQDGNNRMRDELQGNYNALEKVYTKTWSFCWCKSCSEGLYLLATNSHTRTNKQIKFSIIFLLYLQALRGEAGARNDFEGKTRSMLDERWRSYAHEIEDLKGMMDVG